MVVSIADVVISLLGACKHVNRVSRISDKHVVIYQQQPMLSIDLQQTALPIGQYCVHSDCKVTRIAAGTLLTCLEVGVLCVSQL
jgi:hypothetical protein